MINESIEGFLVETFSLFLFSDYIVIATYLCIVSDTFSFQDTYLLYASTDPTLPFLVPAQRVRPLQTWAWKDNQMKHKEQVMLAAGLS